MSNDRSLKTWLLQKPYTLVMSSSFFGFYAHCGLLIALEEAGVPPSRVSGSSAGAIISCAYASGMSPLYIRDIMLSIDHHEMFDPFWKAPLGFGFGRLKSVLEPFLPVQTFEECRIPVTISAYDIYGFRTQVFNSGRMALAVMASCAVPILFQPVMIHDRAYWDGGLMDIPGIQGVPEGERVLYHHGTIIPSLISGVSRSHPDSVTLELDGLLWMHPLRLQRGAEVMDMAREATLRALKLQLPEHAFKTPFTPSKLTVPILPVEKPLAAPKPVIMSKL